MAASRFAGNRDVLADINVTPLVDVMLVLLIIFIVTAPIVARPIAVDLPQPSNKALPRPAPPPPIELRVDPAGQLYWNGAPLALAALEPRLQQLMAFAPEQMPQLRLQASAQSEYQVTAKVLAAARNADVRDIAFVQ